jgi:hypothetical protein
MTWPNPADPQEVAWRLVYASNDETARLVAASYVRAYRYLVEMPERRRNVVIRQLRAAAEPTP